MKKIVMLMAMAAGIGAGMACAGAVTNDLYVGVGETKKFTDLTNGITFTAGMTLRKTGPGILLDDTIVNEVTNKVVNLLLEEGVWKCTIPKLHRKNGTLVIKDGASLCLSKDNKDYFVDIWNVYLEGDGTGTAPYLGAITMETGSMDAMFNGSYSTFTLTDDAVFYGTSASYDSLFFYTTLNMQGHDLVVKGKSGMSSLNRFRPRYNMTITDPGTITVDCCIFDFHYNPPSVKCTVEKPIPLFKFINGAKMASFPNGSLWSKVDAFDFEAGCSVVKAYNSRTAADELTMKRLIGPPAVPALMTLTVSEELVARAGDFRSGNKLQTTNALTFANGCRLSVSGFGACEWTPGDVYSLAESGGGIVGLPTAYGPADKIFELDEVGNSIRATVRSNVVNAGFVEGAEHAADNTARAAALASSLGDGDVLLVQDGEYGFTDGVLDLSSMTARNVTILGDEGKARIKATLKVGAATDLTVEGLTFADTAGPAIVAENTAGLTVVGCTITNVTGACTGVAGVYPFAAVNVTDLDIRETIISGSAAYSAQGYLSQGTQKATSEVYSNAVTIVVAPGLTQNWASASSVLGLAAAAYSGKRLRLTGGGTFAPECSLADVGIEGVEIRSGVYLLANASLIGLNDRLGVAGKPVYVRQGGSLVLAGRGTCMIKSRTLYLAGTGVSSDCGAVHFAGDVSWERARSITWVLDDDTTLTSQVDSIGNGTFLYATIRARGHALTVKGGAWRFGWGCSWNGGGRMIVDGAVITASPANETQWPLWTVFINEPANPGAFFFRNGAKLAPDTPELLTMFNDVTFETPDCVLGASVGTREASLKMVKNYVFKRFSGTPIIQDVPNTETKVDAAARSISITVTNCLAVQTADLLAATPRALEVPTGNLTFTADCGFTLDDPMAISGGTHTLCRVLGADAEITGRPRAIGATAEEAWGTRRTDNHKELFLRRRSGMTFSFR